MRSPRTLPSSLLLGLLWLLSLAGAGCVGTVGDEDTAFEDSDRTTTVFSGELDEGHPSAALLTSAAGRCSGTLIDRRTVLTAAHCVTPAAAIQSSTSPLVSTDGFRVSFFLDGAQAPARSYGVAQIIRHPRYLNTHGSKDVPHEMANDLALLILSEDSQGIAPTPIATSAAKAGWRITIVGYGRTAPSAQDSGRKRVGHNTIASVTNTTYVTKNSGGSETCSGDSGGPSLILTTDGVEILIGVHSTSGCTMNTKDTQVSAFTDWIRSNAAPTTRSGVPAKSCMDLTCAAGTHCETKDGSPLCLKDDSRCGGSTCAAGTHCETKNGSPRCIKDACAGIICGARTHCATKNGSPLCVNDQR